MPTAPHRLLVDGVGPDTIEALARARFPRATRTGNTLVLNRHARLVGPLRAGDSTAYDLFVPVERGAPPLPGPGLAAAFPNGMPIRAELRALDWLTAVARRTGGIVTTADGVTVDPEPRIGLRLVVQAPIWLDPAAGRHIARQVLPGARTPPHYRSGPRGPGRRAARAVLPPGVIEALTAAGLPTEPTAADLARTPLAPPDPEPRYSVVANRPDHIVTVEVDGTGGESETSVAYHVRWVPATPTTIPPDEAVELIRNLAARYAAATGGTVIDEDGFPVDLAD